MITQLARPPRRFDRNVRLPRLLPRVDRQRSRRARTSSSFINNCPLGQIHASTGKGGRRHWRLRPAIAARMSRSPSISSFGTESWSAAKSSTTLPSWHPRQVDQLPLGVLPIASAVPRFRTLCMACRPCTAWRCHAARDVHTPKISAYAEAKRSGSCRGEPSRAARSATTSRAPSASTQLAK
jgi:hypothetical protein